MKKSARHISLTLLSLFLIALASCTHNNGDIGTLFGQWKVRSVSYDGIENPPEYRGDVFWSFQNNVIAIQQSYPDQEAWTVYGTWILEDNTLSLDLRDQGGDMIPSMMLPQQAHLQVLRKTGKEMILFYQPTEQESITYHLVKW